MVNQKAIGATASPVITLYLAGPLESPRDSERRDFKTDVKLPYKVGFGMGIGSVHLEHTELASFMKGGRGGDMQTNNTGPGGTDGTGGLAVETMTDPTGLF